MSGSAPPVRRRASGRPKPLVIEVCRSLTAGLAATVFDLRVDGAAQVPACGPVLLAGNHAGFVDGPLVFALSPRRAALLAKSELFTRWGARPLGWLGQIPVHRGEPDRNALRAGLATLRAGGVLGVFPEGTRGAGELEEVTDGLAYLALRSGAPVVPVAVAGTAAAWPRGRPLPRPGAPVRVSFGRPVQVTVDGDPRARRTVRTAAEQLRLALLDHLHRVTTEGTP